MNIAIINPPHAYEYRQDRRAGEGVFLNGVAYVEATLREEGYKTRAINFDHDSNASLEDVANCDVVGINTQADSFKFLEETVLELKRMGKIVVAGGDLISGFGLEDNWIMQEILGIDYGVIGEGELATSRLMTYLSWGGSVPPGVIYRQGVRLRNTGKAEIIQNLDKLPSMNYSIWNGFNDAVRGKTTHFQTARGCYGNCSFCAKKFIGVRRFSLGRIEKELERIGDLGPSLLWLSDDTFSSDQDYAIKLGKIAQRNGIKYFANTRADKVDLDLLKELKRTGCDMISFGIETFSEAIRNSVGKGVSNQQIFDAINYANQAGLRHVDFFIVGLPGETRSTLDETIRKIKEFQVTPRVGVLTPFPGTRIWDEAVRKGMDIRRTLEGYSSGVVDRISTNSLPINLSEGLTDRELLEARDEIKSLNS